MYLSKYGLSIILELRSLLLVAFTVCSFSDGGLDEMVDEFHGSKIMYGYVRVKEPNTGLPKFVFINWVGH